MKYFGSLISQIAQILIIQIHAPTSSELVIVQVNENYKLNKG